MSNEILIKALSLIARTDGGAVELNAHACYLLAKSALDEYAAQQSAQADVCPVCSGAKYVLANDGNAIKCVPCNGTGKRQ